MVASLVIYAYKNHANVKKSEAHLRISIWHLLMNLKNNYLLKKLLKWPTKNIRILIFATLYFFKKKSKTRGDTIILHLCTKNLDDMIYSS